MLVALVCRARYSASVAPLQAQQSTLDTIRSDVRQGPPPSPTASPAPAASTSSNASSEPVSDDTQQVEGGLLVAGVLGAGLVVSSPFWVPHTLLDDNYSIPQYFPDYPYDNTSGYMVDQVSPVPSRSFAVRTRRRLR